ncbi:tRNA (adenosine(37)-N6)-threonylcarbamoyltransferase complex dimerization subunit type 1 TsaB [Fructilactobacillus myrtifloralis]|uniref:tRNA (Adenosine(37)-N6)-threonylcarbamoyltransferase complex dimerization subunit type 1 TsaB n=1 Tax=Fructilactobacillus myrtifloralis TaxID=2940301 RepID=A0ABY5BPC5_9LACO|nr:tRNA (adenosine(37)-N6)-threonylcarbamoyltransferase complex dimerization subunit type 1 TsaB [Fructilactobacillus myrtifloralis]USS84938.1 tRNA (adenosine(37)-N6)-threonylcarbamoyltransferase complex dimerization subunit type 1 TsaB [Fructilactobacillus myrtifloralis]
MKTLAIDTSNQPLTVAVVDGDRVLATTTITTQRKHAAYAMEIVERLVKLAKLTPADLERVVIANGPGSYTGLRVAVTIGKVLATTLGIELVTVSSLQTLALNVTAEQHLVVPLFDARNEILFTAVYRTSPTGPKLVVPEQHVALADWLQQLQQFTEPLTLVGSDVPKFVAQFQEHLNVPVRTVAGINNLPQASQLAMFGEQQPPVADVDQVVPNYLRMTQAEAEWQHKHPGEGSTGYVEQV